MSQNGFRQRSHSGFTHQVRLSESRNNLPQYMTVCPDIILLNGVYLCVVAGNQQNGPWSF